MLQYLDIIGNHTPLNPLSHTPQGGTEDLHGLSPLKRGDLGVCQILSLLNLMMNVTK